MYQKGNHCCNGFVYVVTSDENHRYGGVLTIRVRLTNRNVFGVQHAVMKLF